MEKTSLSLLLLAVGLSSVPFIDQYSITRDEELKKLSKIEKNCDEVVQNLSLNAGVECIKEGARYLAERDEFGNITFYSLK